VGAVLEEEIKRRLRAVRCGCWWGTDAAGEGLNLQFAALVVNYDLPWNPMKIEQRIGRIDRLGQQRSEIRVLSFAYKDTVEQDVFFTVGSRINLFQGIVGRLQPILSRLPREFAELTLLDRDAREMARQRFLAELEQQVGDAGESGFDIDAQRWRDRWICHRFRNRPLNPPRPGPCCSDCARRGRPRWISGRSTPDRTGLGCRVARPSGLPPIRTSSSSHRTTAVCSRPAATRSARSIWMAPAKAPMAGESPGWSSVLARSGDRGGDAIRTAHGGEFSEELLAALEVCRGSLRVSADGLARCRISVIA